MNRKAKRQARTTIDRATPPLESFAANGEITLDDQSLIDAATAIIKRRYRQSRHTVGCAVLCQSRNIYTSVNIDSCGYGPCAEPIALGIAISNGEKVFERIVAVRHSGSVMAPCGNCRQLLMDYSPDIEVLMPQDESIVRATIGSLLPAPHRNFRH